MVINFLLLFAHISALQIALEPLNEASIKLNFSKSYIQEDPKVELPSNEPSVLYGEEFHIQSHHANGSTPRTFSFVTKAGASNIIPQVLSKKPTLLSHLGTSSDFCGLKHDVIENYLEPPPEVNEFISVAFGVTFDIGLLKDSGSDSCKSLGNMIGDVEMAWVNVDHGEVTKFVADTVITKDKNYKKCIKRGKGEDHCKNEAKMGTPKASYAQTYNNLPFPICMAVRPCDHNNGKLLQEFTFGVRFGGDGVTLFTLKAVDFNLIQLAFSSTGHLSTSQWDEDLPPLLDVVKYSNWGMHVFLEASMAIPLCKMNGKDMLTAEVNAGLGVFAMMKLSNGNEVRSAAEFFGYFIEGGGDLDKIAEKFRTGDSAIKSVNFEVNGMLDGKVIIHLDNIFGTDSINPLEVSVKARNVIQVHLERGNSMFQFWNSFEASTNLKDILQISPILEEIVPAVDLTVLARIYTGIKESGEIDFIGSFKAILELSCGPIRHVLEIWQNLVNTLKDTLKDTPLTPLLDMISLVTDFLASVCDNGLSIGFQIRVNNGLVPYDTFIEFQEKKLRLSDLPICDAGSLGVPASPYAREQAHNHPQGRCKSNNDCFRNDGSYKIGIYHGNHGYCLNHPNLYTVAGCLGRCIKKLEPGANCNKDKMNIFKLAQLDFTNAEHAACQSNQCTCGVCTDKNHKIPNGGKCNGEDDCQSGWCEGDVVVGCKGICRPKRENGQPAWKDWQASCKSGKSQCGTCTSNYRDLANGKACSGWQQCASGWCEGHSVINCRGRCQAKRHNGQSAWHGWSRSCHSMREQCGICTSGSRDLPRNARCSKSNNCQSNYCGCSGWFCTVWNCGGRCT